MRVVSGGSDFFCVFIEPAKRIYCMGGRGAGRMGGSCYQHLLAVARIFRSFAGLIPPSSTLRVFTMDEIWSAALSSSSLSSSSSYHHIVYHRQHRQQHILASESQSKRSQQAPTHHKTTHYTRGPSPRLLLIGRAGRQTQHMNCYSYFFYISYFPALIFDLHIYPTVWHLHS